MPVTSEAQRRLMMAAAHGATFKKAQHLRNTMTLKQLLEYAKVMTPRKQ